MLIPKRQARDLTVADVEAIINIHGCIDFSQLDALIPIGVPNEWEANPGDRIQFGFKFEWQNTSDAKNWHVHGHAPDPKAPRAANASNGWVIRIKQNNRWLLQKMNHPPIGNPSHWTRNRNLANQTHIPGTSETLRRGRSNSI